MVYLMNSIIIFYLYFLKQIQSQALKGALVSFQPEPSPPDWQTVNKHRCTRRFTPGACLESVRLVWTFDFQIQNCTERLGCRQEYRTNRFNTYASCFARCRLLVDLYSHILSYSNNSSKLFLRGGGEPYVQSDLTEPIPALDDRTADLDTMRDHEVKSRYMHDNPASDEEDVRPLNVDYAGRGVDYVVLE